MRVLLNNWDIELDATIINDHTLHGELHTWVGNKLYYCCLTMGGFMQPMTYIPNNDEYYPIVYTNNYLTKSQIADIEHHVKSLRRR